MSYSKYTEPKVSIVVPVYKVEKYLERCIDSILNQTYKNLEVILVDDGSPDRCGEICDKYAQNDERVKSYHKKNGGLSDARNYGMKYITGEYTLFLDSDDWILKDCVETLLKVALKNRSDVVQIGFYYSFENYVLYDNRYYKEIDESINLKNFELMKELVINERVKNFAWGKLYRTSLIKNKFFKKGVLFEDVFWAHDVMKNVKRYTIVHKPLWHYVQREDSIVSTYSVRNLDIIKGLNERYFFIEKFYPELKTELLKLIFKTSILHYNIITKLGKKEFSIYRQNIEKGILNNYEDIYLSLDDIWLKAQLVMFKINPKLNMLPIFLNKVLKKIGLLKKDQSLKRIDL
ncbi:MAG: glycosyltransferase family 2 protein [Cetobacterium sp.]|uniref:glycosyltransferase family 2 protein n=1 Tax=Cetobacterium sp. TaxID=2071632 RepID=UPI003F2AED7C